VTQMHTKGEETFVEGSRTPMTVRTTSKTVTFMHPFNLSGADEVQPAGTYTVETDEESCLSPRRFRPIGGFQR
jgi:hypothetical protein